MVERYNPTNTLTGEERAKMSGRVVGLDMPKLYDPNSVELEEGESKDGKGSLKTMFNQ